MSESTEPDEHSHQRASVKQTVQQAIKSALISFPAANDDYRHLRKRASILCAEFNAQMIDGSNEERCRAWKAIVDPSNNNINAECPTIKGPIHIDYGTNINIHHTCFVNRDCVIADSPVIDISIGANTLIGSGVKLLGVTHPIDWRERQGRQGPSMAGNVSIGNDCFIGCDVIVLPGVTIGDGCVIGAGSVVTESIPPYHVAVGNLARVVRKVALDVADAPGLSYVLNKGRLLVHKPESSEGGWHVEQEYSAHGECTQDEGQLLKKFQSFTGDMSAESGISGKTVLNLGMIILPFSLGYFLAKVLS